MLIKLLLLVLLSRHRPRAVWLLLWRVLVLHLLLLVRLLALRLLTVLLGRLLPHAAHSG